MVVEGDSQFGIIDWAGVQKKHYIKTKKIEIYDDASY